MNERMIELYKQAQEFAYKNISKESWNTDNFHAVVSGKFAELIVRECVGILMKPEYAMNHPGDLADYNRGWVNGRLLGIEHIEEYFGVEQ